MLVVCLTGGIGSGKTVVGDAFAARGVPVIDTDLIARELVEPGRPALSAIIERFGPEYLLPDGALDRRRLRGRVFDDAAARADLERILHPRIGAEVAARLAGLNTPYAIVVIPLLVETGGREYIDRVLVVDVSETTQIERVVARDRVSREQAQAVLAAQASRAERLAAADDVIVNDGAVDELIARVAELHERYTRLAG